MENNIFKYIFTIILLYSAITNKEIVPYKILLTSYAIFVLCSCIYSWKFNGQQLIRVIGNSYPYLGILFSFIVFKYRLNSTQLEKVIKILSISFCLCYIIQFIIYPVNLFSGSLDQTNVNSSVFRMRMPGSICAYCLFFYGINKFLLYKGKKYLLYCLLGFLPIIIMGFRSLNALAMVSTFIMIPFVTKSFNKTISWFIACCILLFIVSQLNIVQNKISEMEERQNSGQTFQNDEYVRYIEYDYFSNTVYVKPGEHIFGGGIPCDPNSEYYIESQRAIETSGLYWIDLGLIGLSFIIGIPAVILLTIIVLGCILKANMKDIQYIRFTLLSILLGSIMTSMELFRAGNLLIISLYICLISEKIKDKKANVNISHL